MWVTAAVVWQGERSNSDIFTDQYLFQNAWQWKNHEHLSLPDLQAVKIRLGQFFAMFHVWQLIKLLKFLQWESMVLMLYSIVTDRMRILSWNKGWFANKSPVGSISLMSDATYTNNGGEDQRFWVLWQLVASKQTNKHTSWYASWTPRVNFKKKRKKKEKTTIKGMNK